MNEQDHTQTVMNIYAAIGRGDVEAILEHVAADVDWAADAAGDAAPWYGARTDHAGVARFFGDLAAGIEITEFVPHAYAATGAHVHNLVRWSFRVRATGRGVSMTMHHYWEFHDGKVVRFRGSEDTALTAAAFARDAALSG